MSETPSNPTGKSDAGDTVSISQDDEILVAYLDGEIPREQRVDIEQRLVNDESLRSRLQSFQKEWDLLDLLPAPATTEKTVQSTIELVVDDIRRYAHSSVRVPTGEPDGLALDLATVSSGENPTRSAARRTGLGWLIPLALFAFAFAAVRWGNYQANQNVVNDFPVAIDMEVYWIAENTSLLEHLSDSTRWRRVVAGTVIPSVEEMLKIDGDDSLFPGRDLSVTAPSQRQLTQQLSTVSTEEQMIVLSRMERFAQLDPSAKKSLRESAQKLRQMPDAQAQLNTLRAYARWREQLSDELVNAIETETGEAREEAIETAIADTITSIGRSTSRNLDNEAIERLDFTLIQIVKQRLDKERNSSNQTGPTQQAVRALKLRGEVSRNSDAIYRKVATRIVFHDKRGEIPPLATSELELIQAMLPSKNAETLERYVDDSWVRALVLEDWAQEALRRKLRGQTKSATLPELYQAMPADQREVLDLMPPEQSRRLLMQ